MYSSAALPSTGSVGPKTMQLYELLSYMFKITNLFCQTSITYERNSKNFKEHKFNYLLYAIYTVPIMVAAVMYIAIGGHLMDHNTVLQFVIRLINGAAFVGTNYLALVNGVKSNPILVGIVNCVMEIDKELVLLDLDYEFDYRNLCNCVKGTMGLAVFYYCFLLGGMYVLNGVYKNNFYMAGSMFVLCFVNIPSAGLFLNCFIIVRLVLQKLSFLGSRAKYIAADSRCYEKTVKYVQFCSRLYCLIPIVAKCYGRILILYSLLSLLAGSMHYYELFEYLRSIERRTTVDHIFVAASILWVMSIQLQLVVLVVTIGKTTDKVNYLILVKKLMLLS